MEGRKGRTAVFLLLLACWLLVLSNGGLAQTWQKVVPCASAAGGSTPTYLGVTSGSYDGAQVGGYTGANAKCVAQYGAGARLMTITDNRNIKRSTNYPSAGWVDIRLDVSFLTNGTLIINDYGAPGGNLQSNSCNNGFTSNSNSYLGWRITTTGSVDPLNCINSSPIHCVRD